MYRMEGEYRLPRDLETRREEAHLGFFDGKRWHTATVKFRRELEASKRKT